MNKIYLILGASSEIGTAYIEHLMTLGEKATVLAHYRNHNPEFDRVCGLDSVLDIVPIQADLLKTDDVERMVAVIKNNYGVPTHILHLSAEKLQYQKLKQINWEKQQADFRIQVESLGRVLQELLPLMAKQRYGKVAIMLSSAVLGLPPKYMTSYVINKYALLGLMKSMAVEYGDKGININGISPNMMSTKFLENIDERLVEMIAEASVKKRNIQIKEVIPSIHYLLSEASDYINGININLSGGDK